MREGTWVVDPGSSQVTFEVRHLGLGHVRGRFTRFEGSVGIAGGELTAAGTVEVASVDTGDERRDHYLCTAEEFFDPAGHPRMEFAAGPVDIPAEGAFRLQGKLTIRGTARPLDLELELEPPRRRTAADGRLVVRADGELARDDYGLRFPTVGGFGDSLVGNTVRIRITAMLVRAGR